MMRAAVLDPSARKSTKFFVDLSAMWEMTETRYENEQCHKRPRMLLLKFAGLISRPSHGRSEAGLVSNFG